MIGQDLDEYAVAIGGGYFYVPPGVKGGDDYLARRLVERSREAGGRLRGLGRPGLERLQRGQAVLDRLPGDGAARGHAAGPGAGRRARLGAARRPGRGRPAVAVLVPAARPGAAVAGVRRLACPLLEPWRAPALLAGALAGWVFFTVFFWGSLYYHLRTGAPWTNFTRFWRLVATNSDPTSGNMLEQVPKMVMALSAGHAAGRGADRARARRDRRRGGAWRARWAAWPGAASTATCCPPTRPGSSRQRGAAARRAPRVRDRGRRRQPRAHVAGPHAHHGPAGPRGHRVPGRGPRLPGPDRRLLLVDAHRRHAGRARHALELRAAARRARRVGVPDARARRQARPPGGHRPPARPVRRGRGALGDLGAAHRADRPLADRRRAQGGGGRGPRPAGAPAAGRRPAGPRARHAQPRVPGADGADRPPRGRLPGLPGRARQARRRHRDPDGRPRPGPRHRRPRPPGLGRAAGAVRGLGPGRGAGRGQHRAALGLRAGPHGQRPAGRRLARLRPRPRADPGRRPAGARPAARGGRCLAIVVARDEEPRLPACWTRCPPRPPGCRWTCWWWTTARRTPRPTWPARPGPR